MPRRPFRGKKAVAVHGPTSGIGNFGDDHWELQVEINLSDDQYIDLEQEAMATLARE